MVLTSGSPCRHVICCHLGGGRDSWGRLRLRGPAGAERQLWPAVGFTCRGGTPGVGFPGAVGCCSVSHAARVCSGSCLSICSHVRYTRRAHPFWEPTGVSAQRLIAFGSGVCPSRELVLAPPTAGPPGEGAVCSARTRPSRPARGTLGSFAFFLFLLPSCQRSVSCSAASLHCYFRNQLSLCPLPNWSMLILKCQEPKCLQKTDVRSVTPNWNQFPLHDPVLLLFYSLSPSLIT